MKMIKPLSAALLFLGSASTALACEPSSSPLYEALEGDWRSDGNAFGQPATSRMSWSARMDECYWQLEYIIETNPDTDSANVFLGRGVHMSEDEVVFGQWIDNRGDMHDLDGSIRDTELLVYWGEPADTLGRSRYRVLEDGNIQVTDWILREDGWRQFNDNVFVRADD
ncbi:MAG: hypothetical protein DHS20C06_03510 [Hyphobacterium sp.]|nr:MAG: hypothetical protein DHS20C06_03510 [Hyphobacterium sp.]